MEKHWVCLAVDGKTAKESGKIWIESDRLLTEKFIGELNNEGMTDEISKEVATQEGIEESTSEWVMDWV